MTDFRTIENLNIGLDSGESWPPLAGTFRNTQYDVSYKKLVLENFDKILIFVPINLPY